MTVELDRYYAVSKIRLCTGKKLSCALRQHKIPWRNGAKVFAPVKLTVIQLQRFSELKLFI